MLQVQYKIDFKLDYDIRFKFSAVGPKLKPNNKNEEKAQRNRDSEQTKKNKNIYASD